MQQRLEWEGGKSRNKKKEKEIREGETKFVC